uniref:Uncharacterized protein n=1 Tax=Arundo donax TaxID=35708 RepID=A0A0A9H4U7_ARUDO
MCIKDLIEYSRCVMSHFHSKQVTMRLIRSRD